MIKIALSKNSNTRDAIQEIAGKLQGINASIIVIFYSSRHAAEDVARLAYASFSGTRTIGCSTSGEIISGEMTDGAMVAMAIDKAISPDVSIAIVDDMSDSSRVDTACQALGKVLLANHHKHVGIVLMDGMSGNEETVMNRLGDLTDLRFIGGSAGDDLAFKATSLIVDGKVFQNSAVLAVLHVPKGFRVIKTQSFCRAGKTLTPTRVDSANREVIEFNDKPAALAYMDAVGVDSLEAAAAKFMSNPVGLMDGDNPYVRSPQAFNGQSLKFYCGVSQDVDLELLQSTDIIADTAKALAEANTDGKVVGIINFNCILRTLELKAHEKTTDYALLFKTPMIGFSTYGEADIGHINQTATMIALLG